MSRIPFTLEAWLKDKNQRVETRDGRIVHDIWPVKNKTTIKAYQTEVCALIDGEEDALVFFAGGKYLPVNAESPFDLFIVTPEEELTDFEIRLLDWLSNDTSGEIPMERMKELSRNRAKELLSLAREQFIKDGYIIEKKAFHDAVEKVDPEVMKEVWKNVRKDEIFERRRQTLPTSGEVEGIVKSFTDYMRGVFDGASTYAPNDMKEVLRTEYEKGRADALKDLPRWKKATGKERFNERMIVIALDNDLLCTNYAEEGEYYISFSDLEKLPKED